MSRRGRGTQESDPGLGPAAASPSGRLYACGPAARWLPRALGACLMLASLIVARRFDAHPGFSSGRWIQGLVVLTGGLLALWVVRVGAEVRLRVRVDEDRLLFLLGRHAVGVELGRIERLEYHGPLAASRHLWPAAVLLTDDGRVWRLPALLRSGPRLLEDLLERSGRNDLRTWAETLRLDRRMSLGPVCVALGYLLSVAVVAGAVWFYVR